MISDDCTDYSPYEPLLILQEIVVSAEWWNSHVPHLIEAVFFIAGRDDFAAEAWRVFRSFTKRFPESPAPLVSMNTRRGVQEPFKLVN